MAVFEPLFKALNDSAVRYIVVGGLAVVLHGHARMTADADLIIDLRQDQARKAIDALTGLGLTPRLPVRAHDFADPDIREGWQRDKGMQVFSLFDPQNPLRMVDIFADHPIPFEELWSRSETVHIGATSIRIASIPDLIHLKQLAGRSQDLDDIEHLEAILRMKNETDHG